MSNSDGPKHAQSPPVTSPSPTPTAPPTVDVEDQAPAAPSTGFGVPGILRRWKRQDLLKRGSLALRGMGLLFSLLSFIIMASNMHGDWKNFDKYEEYRYLLAIAIISTLYTGLQALRQVQELSTGKFYMSQRNLILIDFCGDQVK